MLTDPLKRNSDLAPMETIIISRRRRFDTSGAVQKRRHDEMAGASTVMAPDEVPGSVRYLNVVHVDVVNV